MQVAVTTSQELPELINKARQFAAELEISYLPRQKKSLEKLKALHQLDYLIVVEKEQVILKGETSFFWHPSMAVPRLKAMREGNKDPMVEAMGLQPGYRVLDCTLGFAADALVCAYGIGPQGHVTGLEASKYIAFMTSWGLNNFQGQNSHVKGLLDRVTVVNARYEQYLTTLPNNSFDVVYFDPMFRHGLLRSSSMNALRPLADYQPLLAEHIREALRVARSRVVMKETAKGLELDRLSPHYTVGGRYSPISYGIWEKETP